MTRTHDSIPTSVRLARWYLAAVAVLLLGLTAVTVTSQVALAVGGTTLVFSQDEMDEVGAAVGPAPEQGEPGAAPEPIPAEEATGGVQYVDVTSIGLTFLGGVVAAAGALMLSRRSAWSVPLGLAAVVVTAIVGLIPASIGIWAADYYAMVDLVQVLPFLLVSALLVALSLAAAVAIWRHRELVGAAA